MRPSTLARIRDQLALASTDDQLAVAIVAAAIILPVLLIRC